MYKLLLGTIFLTICFKAKLSANIPRIDEVYYWRDYRGKVPSDAFLSGANNDEEPIYIAQVLYKDLLVPGEIVPNKLEAVFEWGNAVRRAFSNVKILCSKDPTQFQWVHYRNYDFKADDNYIKGGYEEGKQIFIGRGIHDDETVVGKIVIDKLNPIWLHTVHKGEVVRLKEFEVLSFVHQTKRTHMSNKAMELLEDTRDSTAEISFSERNRDCYGGTVVINFN
ncbi:hypothetical protein RI129_010379 [Pyrocoelia pectoralis]|uniref:Uncharacterized protein n=1 Tax=Pyrocoelia pectoralis TaxID=417401 RepID=A0AAN7V6M6_9COLE